MVAFADSTDVSTLLNREFTASETLWVDELTEAASAYLRSVIGQEVYPARQSTYVAYPTAGREDLPQWPVASVDSVQRDAVDVEYRYRPGYITVDCDDPLDVTFTWGYATVPPILKSLTCVLVGQTVQAVETAGGLTFGGLSSIALDDFRAAFADGGAGSGMSLPELTARMLRSQFGRGDVWAVDTR